VLAATRDRADRAGLRTALLQTWRDVDTIDDLQALIQESSAEAAGRTVSMRTAGALALIDRRLRART
jgi:hypothetical protein